MIGTRITLTESDQLLAETISAARRQRNNAARVEDRSMSRLDPVSERDAIGAEIAFARMAGVDPDETTDPRSSEMGTDFGDCVVDGLVIDVKHTRRLGGMLIAVSWKKRGSADFYALMVGSFPNYEYRGVMDADSFLVRPRLRELRAGGGLVYAAEQRELSELPITVKP